MSKKKTQKDVPVPPKKGREPSEVVKVLRALNPNESFIASESLSNKAMSRVAYKVTREKQRTGHSYTIRRTEEGIRVWRTK